MLLKVFAKFAGIFFVAQLFGETGNEAIYTSLIMSTGLTFGTIAALFGMSHGIINEGQYSSLVANISDGAPSSTRMLSSLRRSPPSLVRCFTAAALNATSRGSIASVFFSSP